MYLLWAAIFLYFSRYVATAVFSCPSVPIVVSPRLRPAATYTRMHTCRIIE